MITLTFDLETLPTTDTDVIARIAEKIKPPGNISKAETIEKWMREDRPLAIEKAVDETSLNGTFGSIVCLGWAFDDEEPLSLCGANEYDVLGQFMKEIIVKRRLDNVKIVGHNLIDFDLRFLYQRMIINRIPLPSCIPWNAKHWDDSVFDTMKRWNPAIDKRISLDSLCKALGVPTSKGDMDGSMVADYARRYRYGEIAKYCREDVRATRECYRRMT